MQDLIKAAKALSDETRIRILNVMLDGERCVCEVMQALEISQSRASRNLSILQNAGFLKVRKDGLWTLYSIDMEAANRYAAPLAKLLKELIPETEILAEDKKRLAKAERQGSNLCR